MKENKIKAYMEAIKCIANELSPDADTKVGAALINQRGKQIATGYNGFAWGAQDNALPCARDEKCSNGHDKYHYMQHAERNILYNCLDEGISTRGCTLLTTLSPCLDCLRACHQARIKTIIFDELYWRFKDIGFYTELKDIGVEVRMVGKYTVLDLIPMKEFNSLKALSWKFCE